MQHLPELKKTDPQEKASSPQLTLHNGRRKVYVNPKNDTDTADFVVYHYRSSLCLKDEEAEFSLTAQQKFLTKRAYLLSYNEVFLEVALHYNTFS